MKIDISLLPTFNKMTKATYHKTQGVTYSQLEKFYRSLQNVHQKQYEKANKEFGYRNVIKSPELVKINKIIKNIEYHKENKFINAKGALTKYALKLEDFIPSSQSKYVKNVNNLPVQTLNINYKKISKIISNIYKSGIDLREYVKSITQPTRNEKNTLDILIREQKELIKSIGAVEDLDTAIANLVSDYISAKLKGWRGIITSSISFNERLTKLQETYGSSIVLFKLAKELEKYGN